AAMFSAIAALSQEAVQANDGAPSRTTSHGPQPSALFARALALAPDDPVVAATVAMAVRRHNPALAGRALAQWLAIDAGNAAAWVEHLHWNGSHWDTAEREQVIAAAAAATHHAWYNVEQVQLLATAAADVAASTDSGLQAGPDQEAEHVARGVGIVMALALPSLQTLHDTCRGPALEQAARRLQCNALGQLLARAADSTLAEMQGLRIWKNSALDQAD